MSATTSTKGNWLDTFALAMLVVLLLDLALFGPGLVLPVVGISIRRPLFIGIFGLFFLRHLLSAQAMTLGQFLLLVTISCVAILWATTIPGAYGFPIAYSLSDVLPWTALILLAFWPWDAWPEAARWDGFGKVIVRLSLFLALVHIIVWSLIVSGVITTGMLSLATYGLAGGDPTDDSFIKVAAVGEESQQRVYWSSSIFMLCGLYFHVVNARSKRRLAWLLSFGVLAFALWITQIRAFLGAALIFLALGPMLRHLRHPLLSGRTAAGVLLIWVVCILSVSVAINPQVLEMVGLARDVSDVTRVDQAQALLNAFTSHPFFGMGFGSYSTALIRSSETPYSYELVFYALLMKVGLFGIVALAALLYFSLRIARIGRFASQSPARHSHWVAFTAGFWFAGATNPLVVNFVGMGVLLLLLLDARYFSEPPVAC